MDEITLFTLVRPQVPGFAEPEREEALGQLLAAAAGERAPAGAAGQPGRPDPARRPTPARRPWMTRRLGIGVAAVAALAAAAGVLVALPATGHGSPGGRPHAGTGPGTPATAAAVLLLAAHAAVAAPNLTPRPDQFVYTEQLVEGESYVQGTSRGTRIVKVPPYLQRMWQSADGKRGLAGTQRNLPDGTWSRLGGAESLCDGVQGHPGQQVCYPGYLAKLPRTVSGMLGYLLRADGPNGPAAYRVLGSIVNTSSASGLLVPNASYALMYRAAATVKGIYLVPHVSDIAGRAGIGVAACIPASIDKGSMPGFRSCPERTELIFDARTYQLIGVDNVAAPGKTAAPGRPSTALLGITVVNKIGQLP
jgi:hypothetical protein